MQQVLQTLHIGRLFKRNEFNHFSKFLKPIKTGFIFLLLPEDTTEMETTKHIQFKNDTDRQMMGKIKAIFWSACSIILGLLIAQLK